MSRSIRAAAAIAAVAVSLTFTSGAAAHNAGHVVLPSGECLEVGSFKPVFAGPDKTPLDLIPATPNPPFDEVGTSYAAHQGKSAVLPGPCGAIPH